MLGQNSPFFLTICSGKSGTGKTVLAANIAYALSEMNYKVLLWDADLFFPHQHQLFSVDPQIRLPEVYIDGVDFNDALYKLSGNLHLLADRSIPDKFSKIKPANLYELYLNIEKNSDFDYVIVDTPPAGTNELIQCCSFADEIALMITDEPTSIFDAYGLIKILLQLFESNKIKLLVNNVIDYDDAKEFSNKLNLAMQRFMNIKLNMMGFIPYDRIVKKSIIQQELLLKSKPDSEVSIAIKNIAESLKIEISV